MCSRILSELQPMRSHGSLRSKRKDRRYVMLLFKDAPTQLGNSVDIARRRFLNVERRLVRSPEVYAQYRTFMNEYEQMGHMELVANPNLSAPHYYIPHHCVIKPASESTKLRVVFDASCKTSSQVSFNDILLCGPTIQDDLFMLLLRFRLSRYALTADIAKMYRQVNVDISDRKFQYILWRDFPGDQLRTYQLYTITYGTASAPYLAVRSLHHLADLHGAEFPIGAAVIRTSFYVDDLITGADEISTLSVIKDQVTKLLERGQFPLTKWHSNHMDFVESRNNKDLNPCINAMTSALGVHWHQNSDALRFAFTPKTVPAAITKRTILSVASALYDPLGLLSPLIIVAMIILQELWLAGLSWDESVPQHLQIAWSKCLDSFRTCSNLSVPRYCLQAQYLSVQIHRFCDASIRAYGCAIYLRTECIDGTIAVQLFTSKSRVAPVKRKSLLKLELCGAHLLAQLYTKVLPMLQDKPYTSYFWSDSQIVLHWLHEHSVTLSTFVGNRVSEIQDSTSTGEWRYVPTSLNPADIVSRGATTHELQASIWFSGPPFLSQHMSDWPQPPKLRNLDQEVVNSEKRKSTFIVSSSSESAAGSKTPTSQKVRSTRFFCLRNRISPGYIFDIFIYETFTLDRKLWWRSVVWNSG
ncbi:uncharacterized protein LOC122319803 [Drosophila ficusphila]|uniref:uncharacterized protein LOC122319803 n=1 Tax=Drosophila ficusphila TaxID=30025 RepID=UPI001C8AC940|nr:uncharacterized protein LOC122319803 [Drosophila ficusphila]